MSGPLAGIRVVDLSVNVLGPIATQVLGDMGADVIKVENGEGDPMRYVGPSRHTGMGAFFLNCNRNKRSVLLDLKQPAAKAKLMALIETADVFVHSMRQSAAERLGIGHAAVMGANPRIIYAVGTGYSQSGPYRDKPAFDDVIQGECGLAALNGHVTGEPHYVPTPMVDKMVGMVLASAVGMALYRREKTGQGEIISVPMLETMVSFNMVEHLWNGVFGEPEKGLGYPRMLSPHRRPYRAKDGFISLLAHTDEHWRKMFVAIGKPELAADPRFLGIGARTVNIDALYEIVAEAITTRTIAEWHAAFDAADIPNAPVNDLHDVVTHPYLRDTGFFQTLHHPTEGDIVTTKIPVAFTHSPGSIRRGAPRLGEHTDEVFRELGVGDVKAAHA